MAADNTIPDGFEQAPTSDDSDQWLDQPEAGGHVVGSITGFRPDAGYNGVVELDDRPLSLNKSLRNQLLAALVEGETILITAEETPSSFTDDDGEEVEYFEKTLHVQTEEQ
jgi:hypothetical protein